VPYADGHHPAITWPLQLPPPPLHCWTPAMKVD